MSERKVVCAMRAHDFDSDGYFRKEYSMTGLTTNPHLADLFTMDEFYIEHRPVGSTFYPLGYLIPLEDDDE